MNETFSLRIRFGLLAAALGISACVSDSQPREGDDDPPSDARTDSDARESGADSTRRDADGGAVPEDVDIATDGKDAIDEPTADASADVSADANDAADARATDVTTTSDVIDVTADIGVVDVRDDARDDATDAGAFVDANDAGAPIDVNDSGVPSDASDAPGNADASDSSAPGDGGDGGSTTSDAADAPVDAGVVDAGVVVFYTENFDTGLGGFSATTVCSPPPVWSNNAGYAHATEPTVTGVSRITSPVINVPANATNVTLRMSHKFDLEPGWDAAQLLISVNGATATQITTFVSGGYTRVGTTSGGATNPATCVAMTQSQYPGWSDLMAETVSVVNLSTVVGNNTIRIVFQMLTDPLMGGNGWDINWVTLSANLP